MTTVPEPALKREPEAYNNVAVGFSTKTRTALRSVLSPVLPPPAALPPCTLPPPPPYKLPPPNPLSDLAGGGASFRASAWMDSTGSPKKRSRRVRQAKKHPTRIGEAEGDIFFQGVISNVI